MGRILWSVVRSTSCAKLLTKKLGFLTQPFPIPLLHCLFFRCGPCKFIGPVFAKLSDENPEALFVHCDVDEAEEVAAGK